MRLAYADPPYPGKSHLYKDHKDYGGEVDHEQLIEELVNEYDGWALSTWEPALAYLLPMCPEGTRILAWCRTNEPPFHAFPCRSWEPVLLVPARKGEPGTRSYHMAGAPTGFLQKQGLTGQKPRSFCEWIIRCLGAKQHDTLTDVFPGTGIMGETWKAWQSQLSLPLTAPTRRTNRQRPQHRKAEIDAAHGGGLPFEESA